jgi:hypothetical protein
MRICCDYKKLVYRFYWIYVVSDFLSTKKWCFECRLSVMYICVCVFVRVRACVYICMCLCVYICMYVVLARACTGGRT